MKKSPNEDYEIRKSVCRILEPEKRLTTFLSYTLVIYHVILVWIQG